MNNEDFMSRVYAFPDDTSADMMESARKDPERQRLLEEIREFDSLLKSALLNVPLPESFPDRLKSAALNDDSNVVFPSISAWQGRRPWILAASILLAVTFGFSNLPGTNSGPSADELAFGEDVLAHVHQELALYDNGEIISLQRVNQVMGSVGSQLLENAATRELTISFAKPCFIVPQQTSAHLVIRGENGLINVIVVNNSPVSQSFTVVDERYSGTVVPLESGNMILVGENNESMDNYVRLLVENVDWII